MNITEIEPVLKKGNFSSILITGPWGSGKTYLLKNIFKGDAEVSFVSIQDCNDQIDIKLKILQSLGGFEKVVSDMTNFLPDISHYGVSLNPGAYIKKGLNFWTQKKLQKKSLHTIVLDDWERSKIDVQDLFAFIDEQKLNRKVICVANEDKIKDQDALTQVEKFFDIIIEIQQDPNSVLDDVLTKYNLEMYRGSLHDYLFNNPNIRTLQKILLHLDNIHNKISLDNLDLVHDEIFLFVSYFLKCQTNGIKFSEHRSLLQTQSQFSTTSEEHERLEEKRKEILSRFQKCKIHEAEDMYFKSEGYTAFLDYIQHMDTKGIEQYLKNLIISKQDLKDQEDWRKIWQWRSLEDNEIKDIGIKAIQSVFNGKIDVKKVLLVVSSIFDLFSESCITEEELNKLTVEIERGISEDHEYIYHDTASGVDDDIFDHGGAYGMAFSNLKNNHDLLQRRNILLNKCRDSYLKYLYNPKHKTLEVFQKYLTKNENYPYDKTFSNDPIFKENIFDSITANQFIKMYSDLSNEKKREVNALLDNRFRYRNLHRLKGTEVIFKRDIINEIDQAIIALESNTPSKIHYEHLKRIFQNNPPIPES